MTTIDRIREESARIAKSSNRKVWAKKANDEQMLDKLAAASRALLDAVDSGNQSAIATATRELRTYTAIVERRSK